MTARKTLSRRVWMQTRSTVNPAVDDTVAVDAGESAEDECGARRPVVRGVGKVAVKPDVQENIIGWL